LGKKCIICGEEAEFSIKGTSDYYCKECAEEHFADLSVLKKVEEEAQKLKDVIKKRIEGESDEDIIYKNNGQYSSD
jgi:hypothetical protein